MGKPAWVAGCRLASSLQSLERAAGWYCVGMEEARLVKPGEKLNLSKEATKPTNGITKQEALAKISELKGEFAKLVDLFAFSAVHPLLIILQGMDAAGKDGAARHLFGMTSVITSRVASFKKPTEEELAHDYLWRVHKQTPGKGELVIFNRSHYEDVLVVRVHELAPLEAVEKRYGQINAFEDHLIQNSAMILKFFLHITKEEQEERLLEREEDHDAAWKLAAADWREREHWEDYEKVYELALSRCSTEAAPWQIVPSDKKWYRNLVITEAVITALKEREETYLSTLKALGEKRTAELAAYKSQVQR